MYTIMRIPQVIESFGIARPTLYQRCKAGLMPPPIKLGRRASGFPSYEVEAVKHAYIAGQSEADIRALVTRLVAERQQLAA